MTLRGRLTTAFLVVVLGPVLLGAVFVGGTVATVSRDRAMERLDVAADTVRTVISTLCRQLQAAADAIAVLPTGDRRTAADQIVARDLASAVQVADPVGAAVFTTAGSVAPPWADCAGAADRAATTGPTALAAGVELRDGAGALLGTVRVARVLDAALVARLAGAAGAAVTLLTAGPAPAGPPGVLHSTEPAGLRATVAARAGRLADGQTGRTEDGRHVRRVGPAPGQPLTVAVSVPGDEPRLLYAVLLGCALLTGLLAVLAARRLAHSTTRPLAELAQAAARVAAGDLNARVPVRRPDEVGRLADAFNRMTREMQQYVQALTASRDQLRGHLGILGDTLSSTHDLHRILEVILRTALAATGARAGVVLLVDPAAGVLVGQCGEGLAGRLPRSPRRPAAGAGPAEDRDPPAGGSPRAGATGLRLPLGEGVLGAVGAGAEPRRGRVGPDGSPLSPDEPRCRTFVAVPICAPAPPSADLALAGPTTGPMLGAATTGGSVTLGVLALYDGLGADGFDDADLRTLRTFAGQAGVAVENVRVHEEAQRLSLTDPLTGLWNYRCLTESIRREVERASRFGRRLAVLVLDLDHFKEVNDTYGHAAGDAVLAEFGRRVRRVVREVDLAFRQGGEEFVVLLPETDARGGVTVAERLATAIRERPVGIEPAVVAQTGAVVDSVPITVSIGIGVYPHHGLTAEQLLAAADRALYVAKAAGRDTYRLAVSTDQPVGQEVTVATGSDDVLPVAGAPGGAPAGPHPPRQSRGR